MTFWAILSKSYDLSSLGFSCNELLILVTIDQTENLNLRLRDSIAYILIISDLVIDWLSKHRDIGHWISSNEIAAWHAIRSSHQRFLRNSKSFITFQMLKCCSQIRKSCKSEMVSIKRCLENQQANWNSHHKCNSNVVRNEMKFEISINQRCSMLRFNPRFECITNTIVCRSITNNISHSFVEKLPEREEMMRNDKIELKRKNKMPWFSFDFFWMLLLERKTHRKRWTSYRSPDRNRDHLWLACTHLR